jgi:hypothetical protein
MPESRTTITPCAFSARIETATMPTEIMLQSSRIHRMEVSYHCDPGSLHTRLCHLSHSGDTTHGYDLPLPIHRCNSMAVNQSLELVKIDIPRCRHRWQRRSKRAPFRGAAGNDTTAVASPHILRYPFAPGRSMSADCPKVPAIGHLRSGRPFVHGTPHPVWHRYRANVPTFTNQIDY